VGQRRLIQAIAGLGKPRIGAGFVLAAARRAAQDAATDEPKIDRIEPIFTIGKAPR
jgi:hypothetical protein